MDLQARAHEDSGNISEKNTNLKQSLESNVNHGDNSTRLHITEHPQQATTCIIGKGAKAVVFYPAFRRTNTEEYLNIVSKVTSKGDATHEHTVSKLVRRLDTILEEGTEGTLSATYLFGVYSLRYPSSISEYVSIQSLNILEPQSLPTYNGELYVLHMERAAGDMHGALTLIGEYLHRNLTSRGKRLSIFYKWYMGLNTVLEGMMKMHSNHIYHFDMKPQNLLYFFDSECEIQNGPKYIKLADFGLTRTLSEVKERSGMDSTYDTPPFARPWFNYPPALYARYRRWKYPAETVDHSVRQSVDYWTSNEQYRIGSALGKSQNYSWKQIVENSHTVHFSMLRLCVSSDIYGFAMCLDSLKNIVWDFPDLKEMIDSMVDKAVTMNLDGEECRHIFQKIGQIAIASSESREYCIII